MKIFGNQFFCRFFINFIESVALRLFFGIQGSVPGPEYGSLDPASSGNSMDCFFIPAALFFQADFSFYFSVIRNSSRSFGRHATGFCEKERFLEFVYYFFDSIQLIFPVIFRIITT